MTESGGAAPEPPEEEGNRNIEDAAMLGFFVVLVAAGIWLLGTMADVRKAQDCAAAHDPAKCKRFGDKIMRSLYDMVKSAIGRKTGCRSC